MIFLQPFGTYSFESNHKYLIFFGFGLLFFMMYLLWSRIENLWYNYKSKNWEIKDEIISFILFILISSVPIHFYNEVFLNDFFNSKYYEYDYLKHGLWFFQHSIVPIMLILLPFYIYLRSKFGELITSDSLNEIDIYGINKDEKITIKKEELLYIKASENYVNIYYTKNNIIQLKTFRSTLTAVKKQVPFLYKSHRSYLVNLSEIKAIKGNSQNGKIEFHYEGLLVPLSKSYYKTIKSMLGI
ncbi:LytTR family DNA-binding domain-containing protein [Croceitalea rosinachiae]|uniref:LytTR family DNA-binding domain-containing protein n=1 Tax=Croceitalea rosinachiae TaxID=3075596 RepID=A0ABU3A872_9FLAO|nr:LytTR family DNA-binding domain-containing protein [Croceitalea sp. F388]MDT0606382.1 LytTR family DNA-binding domain-containing protein [Croceitalea sp. F388]